MTILRRHVGIVGTSFGLIRASVDVVSRQFLHWQSSIGATAGFALHAESTGGDVSSVLARLFPLTAPVRQRYLFLKTNSEWTAFFDNGTMGTDATGVMTVLAAQLDVMAIRALSVPHTMPAKVTASSKGYYGANILEVYDGKHGSRRSVYCANDGGKWKFGQTGEAFEFEDQNQYALRRVADRFTENMLRAYLGNLAVDAFDDAAYPSGADTGVLIWKSGALVRSVEIDLSDALRNSQLGTDHD